MAALITFQNVCKFYHMGDSTVTAADHISFEIGNGEFTAIVGSSGSGRFEMMIPGGMGVVTFSDGAMPGGGMPNITVSAGGGPGGGRGGF